MTGPTWKPLHLWCADGRPDMGRIKAAKLRLDLPYTVAPTEAEGSAFDRVLAWGSRPPFVCAYVLVDDGSSDSAVEAAVAWALGETEDFGAMEVEDALSVIFGPGVREVTAEELLAEQRLADYEAGR